MVLKHVNNDIVVEKGVGEGRAWSLHAEGQRGTLQRRHLAIIAVKRKSVSKLTACPGRGGACPWRRGGAWLHVVEVVRLSHVIPARKIICQQKNLELSRYNFLLIRHENKNYSSVLIPTDMELGLRFNKPIPMRRSKWILSL